MKESGLLETEIKEYISKARRYYFRKDIDPPSLCNGKTVFHTMKDRRDGPKDTRIAEIYPRISDGFVWWI